MGVAFVKLNTDKTVSSNGQFVFKKLTFNSSDPGTSEPGTIDLSVLRLAPGAYTITVTAKASWIDESEESNSLIYVTKY